MMSGVYLFCFSLFAKFEILSPLITLTLFPKLWMCLYRYLLSSNNGDAFFKSGFIAYSYALY